MREESISRGKASRRGKNSLKDFCLLEDRGAKQSAYCIDIGRPKGFFQCNISGSNGIHRYRKIFK